MHMRMIVYYLGRSTRRKSNVEYGLVTLDERISSFDDGLVIFH